MLWLILSIINAVGYAICGFFDNYITDVVFRGKKQESIKFYYGITYILAAIAIFLIFGTENIGVTNIAWLFFAGVLSSTASIPYYRALKDEETTTASIFLQLTPVIYLIADALFFGEKITPIQLIAFVVIISAPLVIILSRRRKNSRRMELNVAFLFITYVILAAASGVISAHVGSGYEFTTTFSWLILGRGIADLVYYYLNPSWRKRFKYVAKHDGKRLYISLTVAQVVFLIAEFAGRYALIVGTPALVSVTSNALEMITVFVLGIILTIIAPRFGREKLSKHIIIAHFVATILAVGGIILLH